MNDEILAKLQQRVGRRSFLKGSGLAVATIAGACIASPLFAQPPPPTEQQQDEKKKDDKADAKKKDDKDKKDDGPDKETKIDAEGNEYRVCPQCGSNMYRQGRTWTCENCGYSYVE